LALELAHGREPAETKERLMTENANPKALPLKWVVPEDLVSRYANNFTIQHTEYEFVISFFETFPPLVLGSPDERQAQLEQLESVPAKCVARIVVSPERVQDLVQILAANLETYHSMFHEKEEPDGSDGSSA